MRPERSCQYWQLKFLTGFNTVRKLRDMPRTASDPRRNRFAPISKNGETSARKRVSGVEGSRLGGMGQAAKTPEEVSCRACARDRWA